MLVVLLARNPTDSVTDGLLPAAHRAGLSVLMLTDHLHEQRAVLDGRPAAGAELPEVRIESCDVTEVRAVLAAIDGTSARPAAVISNSDHLQTQTALVADYLGLPGKDWRSAIRARDKGLMRAALHRAGLDDTPFLRLRPEDGPERLDQLDHVPYPLVLKPAEGVASEDVVLVEDRAEAERVLASVRARRQGDLVADGFLAGPLHTLETLGDAAGIRVWGSYRTTVSAAPYFIEERLTWAPHELPEAVVEEVLVQLRALGVGFGACHTEFVLTAAGPRIVEVNDRLIGDHCDFAMAELLGEPIFGDVLSVYLGGTRPAARPAVQVDVRDGPDPFRHGHVHWVLNEADGVLVSAPPASARTVTVAGGEARLAYRPVRQAGDRVAVTGTNRDYLGSLQVLAPDAAVAEAATEEFLRTQRWVVE